MRCETADLAATAPKLIINRGQTATNNKGISTSNNNSANQGKIHYDFTHNGTYIGNNKELEATPWS